MDIKIGLNRKQAEGFEAFIPNLFPPKEGLRFDSKLLNKNDLAVRLLGKLDGITKLYIGSAKRDHKVA